MNSTLDKTAAQNLNIINKRSLFILKLCEIGKKKLLLRKKWFYISMKAEEYLEQIINLKKIKKMKFGIIKSFMRMSWYIVIAN